jgi:hypothetical protein
LGHRAVGYKTKRTVEDRRGDHGFAADDGTVRTGLQVREAPTMTVRKCVCGTEFTPKRKDQRHHLPECRQITYRASAKRAAVVARYQATGATAANSRRYRERAAVAGQVLVKKLYHYKIEELTPEMVWTKQTLQEMNPTAVMRWIDTSKARKYRYKQRDLWNAFFTRLYDAVERAKSVVTTVNGGPI